MKRFLLYFSIITLTLGLAGLFLFVGALGRTDWSYPSVFLGANSVGMLSKEAVRAKINSIFSKYQAKPLLFAFEGEAAKVNPQELGAQFDPEETFHKIPLVESKNPIDHFLETLTIHHVTPYVSFERGKILKILEEKFTSVKFMKNARYRYDPDLKKVVIVPEERGIRVDEDSLIADLKDRFARLSREPIFLSVKESFPDIYKEDLEAEQNNVFQNLPKRIFLKVGNEKWELKFPADVQIIEFQKKNDAQNGILSPFISEKDLEWLLENRGISQKLEYPPDGLKIYKNTEGKIQFEGHGKSGRRIEREILAAALTRTIAEKLDAVEIPVSEVQAPLNISEDLQAMGIKEPIGVGYSTFYGSPRNRIYNIGVGVSHFNGTLIAPGETYSMVENLGPVDATTGYKEELVIRHDGTKPEYGGGLCQVSTTFYRGALNSGLPIVERAPHSYAVTYYSQAGGHGLDATIYPGSHDLKFLNDTPGHILVHSYVEGLEAYFKFYGTFDSRTVSFEGPFIANRRAAPPDEIIYTKELKEGEKKQEEKPHTGFDTTWYRYIAKNGGTVKETVFSRYKAIPAKFLIGGEGPSKVDAEIEAARQFE